MRLWIALACATLLVASDPPGKPKPAEDTALFGDLPTVEAAALHAQTLAEAPASVSVITASEIRRYGYRTLGEALASVRGFYVTYDHTYHFVGVAGLSLPGDFNTRFLVMLNGHPLTDSIYNSNNFFGQDFGLDLDLVERIEIIRGPTGALYGSNGMLANINVVTRSPVDAEKLRVAVETDSEGERKVSVASSVNLGHGANLLISASVFNNRGISFPLDGLALPPGVTGPVANADGERGYHTFANLIWHDWSFTAYFNAREKQPPVGLGTSFSGDSAQRAMDGRDLLSASYKRQAGPGSLRWQFSYDRYRYHDLYDYPGAEDIDPVRDVNRGDWLDSKLMYEFHVRHVGLLTAGFEGFWELRNQQYNLVDNARQEVAGRPDRGAALFAQQEWNLSARWTLHAGVRVDETRNNRYFVSPRVAAVYQRSKRTVYKLVYGRPFRNPSAFEQFYNDGGLSYLPAPQLQPETAHTFEASVEHQTASGLTLAANAFQYRIRQVIEAISLADGVQQYQNQGKLRSTGASIELSGKPWNRLEASASLAMQRAVAGGDAVWLANSPLQIAKVRLGLPLGGKRVFLSTSAEYLSRRLTSSGDCLGGALLADVTGTIRLNSHFDLQTGLRNALDRRYEDPIYLTVDRLRGDGRSAFMRLIWHIWE